MFGHPKVRNRVNPPNFFSRHMNYHPKQAPYQIVQANKPEEKINNNVLLKNLLVQEGLCSCDDCVKEIIKYIFEYLNWKKTKNNPQPAQKRFIYPPLFKLPKEVFEGPYSPIIV